MKSKVNERKSMGDIQLGDVYNDQGQHFKVIIFQEPDHPYPVGGLLCTGAIMFYNEQTVLDCQLIERDGQEVIKEEWVAYDPDDDMFHGEELPKLKVRCSTEHEELGVTLGKVMTNSYEEFMVIEWYDGQVLVELPHMLEFLVE